MDGLRKALLVVGLLNLVALGGVACGGKAAPDADAGLRDRVVRLEAFQMFQQKINGDLQGVLDSQQTLNKQFQSYMEQAAKHASSVDRTLEKQQEAMGLVNEVLHDLLKKLK